MGRVQLGAVAYRFRAELRRRHLAWVAVGLVIGLAGGLVLALFAGARRTESAYDRFVVGSEAADVTLISGIPGVFDFAPLDFDGIAEAPEVADAALIHVLQAAGRTPDGVVVSTQTVNIAGDPTGRLGVEVNRFKVVDGRLADPGRPDEVVVNFPAAESLSVSVGDVLRMHFLAGNEVGAVFAGEGFERFADLEPFEELHVVGIVAVPGDFPPAASSTADIEFVYLTPALLERYAGVPTVEGLAVQLEGGAASVRSFLGELQATSGDLPVLARPLGEQADVVRNALGKLAGALRIAGALAGVVAALVVGQLLARQALVESSDTEVLASLGFSRREHGWFLVLKAMTIASVAAVAAAVGAVALSPLFPIGLARLAEPAPGFHVDVIVLPGALVVLLTTSVIALLVGALSERSRRRTATLTLGAARRGAISGLARRLGGAAPAPAGMAGMALVSGHRGAGTAVAGIGLGLLTVLGVVTFSASLDRLRDTPALYGWGWDVMVGGDFGQPLDGKGVERVASDPAVEGMEVGAFLDVEVGGRRARALAIEPVTGDVVPVVADGRAPQASDEVVLASRAAADVEIGDRVLLTIGGRAADVEVVGRGPLPDVDVLLDFRTARELSVDLTAQIAVIELAPGADTAAFGAAAAEAFGLPPTEFQQPELPTDLANFGRADATPAVIGGLMGLVSVATLFHVLVLAVQRGGGTLAVLRTIGFTSRQLLSAVTCQAVFLVMVSFLFGLPLGIALGRWAWIVFAESLGVVPEPSVPVAAVALTATAALVIGILVASFPGWRAGRTSAAAILRRG